MSKKASDRGTSDEMAFIKAQTAILRQMDSLSFAELEDRLRQVEHEFTKRAQADPTTADEIAAAIQRRTAEALWITACMKRIPFAEGCRIFQELQACHYEDVEHEVTESILYAEFCRDHGRTQLGIDHLLALKDRLLRDGVAESSLYVKALDRVLGGLSDPQ